MHVLSTIHVNFRLQRQGKETNLRALFSLFIEKRLLRWDSNPRPPAFKAVALPTESPRQHSWLGSNHTSYKAKCLISPDKRGKLKLNI